MNLFRWYFFTELVSGTFPVANTPKNDFINSPRFRGQNATWETSSFFDTDLFFKTPKEYNENFKNLSFELGTLCQYIVP